MITQLQSNELEISKSRSSTMTRSVIVSECRSNKEPKYPLSVIENFVPTRSIDHDTSSPARPPLQRNLFLGDQQRVFHHNEDKKKTFTNEKDEKTAKFQNYNPTRNNEKDWYGLTEWNSNDHSKYLTFWGDLIVGLHTTTYEDVSHRANRPSAWEETNREKRSTYSAQKKKREKEGESEEEGRKESDCRIMMRKDENKHCL